jgi:beta-lactamase regulating signal transducer with metallopeptidase domain
VITAELMDTLRTLLPNIVGLAVVTGLLASALLAVWLSRNDLSLHHHAVLLIGIVGAGAVVVVCFGIRLLLGTPFVGDDATADGLLLTVGVTWLLGLLALVVRFGVGSLEVGDCLAARGSVRAGDERRPLLGACADHVGLDAIPKVVFAHGCHSPLATGIWKPAILLPMELKDAPDEVLRIVLLHEFAHVRRRDCLVELVVQIIGALMWWNPLYWIAARRLRFAREVVCDQIVLWGRASRTSYVKLLLRYATHAVLPVGPAFAVTRMSVQGTLAPRVRAMMERDELARQTVPVARAMTNLETAWFMIVGILVAVALDAMMLTLLADSGEWALPAVRLLSH